MYNEIILSNAMKKGDAFIKELEDAGFDLSIEDDTPDISASAPSIKMTGPFTCLKDW